MKEHGWLEKMTQEDLCALSPLIYNHITPYGRFDVDLDQHLPCKKPINDGLNSIYWTDGPKSMDATFTHLSPYFNKK